MSDSHSEGSGSNPDGSIFLCDNMTSLDKAVIARYEKGGKRFEIYVDPEKADMYKEGKKKDLNNILVVEEVYSDAKKGERAKTQDIEQVFHTTDIMHILEIILKEGELQLTTAQRRKKLEEKTKQIVSILCRETIDPRTGAPHTEHRIRQALEEAKVHIDAFKDARDQIPGIIKKIQLVLPMKFERVKIAVKVPPQWAAKAYGTLKNYGIKQEQWLGDGHLIVVVEMPAGMQGEFFDKLNRITHGENETKILR